MPEYGFTTGRTACAGGQPTWCWDRRRLTDDYSASLAALARNTVHSADALHVLDLLERATIPCRLTRSRLIAIVKAITFEIYVLGLERIESLEYLSDLMDRSSATPCRGVRRRGKRAGRARGLNTKPRRLPTAHVRPGQTQSDPAPTRSTDRCVRLAGAAARSWR